jgi:hypothetical protein
MAATTQFLKPGESLVAGQYLQSPNGHYRYWVRVNGAAIEKDGKVIWGAYRPDIKVAVATMQKDGNYVVYDANNHKLWDSSTHNGGAYPGGPGSYLQLQDDSNLVVYGPKGAVWDASGYSMGGGFLSDVGDAFSNSAATAGRVLGAGVNTLGGAVSAVGDLVQDIPIIGPAFIAVIDIAAAPLTLALHIAEGERIDQAVMGALSQTISAIQTVAPYVQTVISFIPGIGSGISAAISGGLALMSGMPIDDVLIAAVRGAIPGGPLAAAAFSITAAAIQGKNIITAGLDEAARQLNLPPAAISAIDIVSKTAQGENLGQASLEEARKYIPAGPVQQAFDIGVAVAQGKNMQQILLTQVQNFGASQMKALADIGTSTIGTIPVFQSAQQLIDQSPDAQAGFKVGIGLLSNSGFNQQVVGAIRGKLPSSQVAGFDAALTAHIGAVVAPPPNTPALNVVNATPVGGLLKSIAGTLKKPTVGVATSKPSIGVTQPLSGTALAAYYMTKGMAGGNPAINAATMQTMISRDPNAKIGATVAIVQVANIRAAHTSFWDWILHLIGLQPSIA